jgi:enoyl-CoA hydratase/carnithine racemase
VTTASADPEAKTSRPPVLWSREGAVGIATLNRPHALNALTVELLEHLEQHADEAERDPAVRALVIAGSGERAFCAGADLKTLEQEYSGDSVPDRLVDVMRRVYGRLERLELPVIAAVHGYCFGGGLELMLTADLCIAADDSRFAGESRPARGGGTQRLPRLIRPRLAKGWCLRENRSTRERRTGSGRQPRRPAPPSSPRRQPNRGGARDAFRRAQDEGSGQPVSSSAQAGPSSSGSAVFLRETGDRREGVSAFVEKGHPLRRPPDG